MRKKNNKYSIDVDIAVAFTFDRMVSKVFSDQFLYTEKRTEQLNAW